MNILAIDLGKFNSMCCFFDTVTQKHSFWTAATTRRYMTTLLKQHTIDLVVMEACGPSGWISDLCQELGLETLVCSTNDVETRDGLGSRTDGTRSRSERRDKERSSREKTNNRRWNCGS